MSNATIIVPTLQRGSAAGDAPASRQAGVFVGIDRVICGRDVVGIAKTSR